MLGEGVIRDHDVVVIDNLATVPDQAKIDHSRVTFIEGSVTDLLMGTFPGAAGIFGGNPVRAPAGITIEKSPGLA